MEDKNIMSNYQGVFQRYEKKYLISKEQSELLVGLLSKYMIPDEHAENVICNVYYDTPEYLLVSRSLEKPIYKEKLRVRSYGLADDKSLVFIELKKKYENVVYKRRVSMPFLEAQEYMSGAPIYKPNQITKEIDYFLYLYGEIVPSMFISYNRFAIKSKDNDNSTLRITFDKDILWRTDALSLNQGIWGNKLLDRCETLMEIKVSGALPLWLVHILNSLHIFPSSFSKYGKAYLQYVTDSKEAIVYA